MRILNLLIAIILFLIGVFYVFMSHATHISSGIGFGLAHTNHVIIGIIALIIGVIVLLIGRK